MRCESCGHIIPSERSVKQHKLYWACINFLFMHQRNDVWANKDDVHEAIKMGIGHTKKIYGVDGQVFETTLTTSFYEMPQDKFNEYFERFQDLVWQKIIPFQDEAFEREWCNLTRVFNGVNRG